MLGAETRSVSIRKVRDSQKWVSERKEGIWVKERFWETWTVHSVLSKWTLTNCVILICAIQVNTLRVLPASIPVSHSTHFNVLSEPLVPWILSFLGDGSSIQLQWSARRWHQASILWKGTAELPPFWDSWTVVRGVRGIFTVSVASEVEFSQVLIKLIVPLLLCSLSNLVPTSEEAKLERSFC